MPHTPHVPPPRREPDTPLELPGLARTVVVLGRALRLRCPNCGRGQVMASWRETRDHCERCGLRFHRGDAEYYSAGVMFANLAVAEIIFAIGFVIALLVTWPHVPWDALTYGSMFLMVILPLVLYPFSKVAWLAADILIRPITTEEFVR